MVRFCPATTDSVGILIMIVLVIVRGWLHHKYCVACLLADTRSNQTCLVAGRGRAVRVLCSWSALQIVTGEGDGGGPSDLG